MNHASPLSTVEIIHANLVEDQAHILDLLGEYLREASLGTDAAPARFEWMYRQNPHGEATTLLAIDRAHDNPIGVTSIFPRRVATPTGERIGGMGGDTFVRPSHRRLGLARAIHQFALAHMDQKIGQVEFMFTAPNPNTKAAIRGSGGVLVGGMRRHVRPNLRGLPARHALDVVPLDANPDPRVDAVWEQVAPSIVARGGIIPVRDARHTAWRYGASPAGVQRAFVLERHGVPVALAACEQVPGRLIIVDLFAPQDRLRDCLLTLAAWNRREGPGGAVEIRVHEGARMARHLLTTGFLPRERKPFQVQCPPSASNREALLAPRAWWFTPGDLDIERI